MSKKKIICDVLLIVLLLAVSSILYFAIRETGEAGAYAEVSVNGEKVAEYPLDKDGEYVLNGGTNILVISDFSARVINSDCPDKTCERQGKISMAGERIVCLPNKLMVEIVGDKEEIIQN